MKNIILIFLTLVINSIYGQDNPFFFIQLTDTQFGMYDSKNIEKETELYEKAVEHINRLKPDFVVITGDLVNKPDSEEQLTEFKRITKLISSEIPVYVLPGNHDVKNKPDRESIKYYLDTYNYQWFSFEHNSSQFIGLNTSIIKSHYKKYERKQFKFLEKSLKKAKDADHIVVFTHYPFFNDEFDEAEGYSNIDPDTRLKYLDLFSASSVDAIFSGHLHENRENEYKGMQVITTGPVGKPLGDDPSGFRVVKVFPDKIESEYYGLEEVPDAITFNN